MRRPLRQVREILKDRPLLIAGDIFDKSGAPPKWLNSSELINFAMEELPDNCIAIPGQHDLPMHRLDAIKQSSYWTLVASGKISNLEHGRPRIVAVLDDGKGSVTAHGFPWGCEIKPPERGVTPEHHIDIAICHRYVWYGDAKYQQADEKSHIGRIADQLLGYKYAFFGDNHKLFLFKNPRYPTIVNCGTFYRRKSDEKDYKTYLYVILKDGRLARIPLDNSEDRFLDDETAQKLEAKEVRTDGFLTELAKLGDSALNYAETVRHMINAEGIPEPIRRIMILALERE